MVGHRATRDYRAGVSGIHPLQPTAALVVMMTGSASVALRSLISAAALIFTDPGQPVQCNNYVHTYTYLFSATQRTHIK